MGFRIVAVGGDDRSGAPEPYVEAVRALLAELSGPRWLAWWAPADYDVLEIWYDLDAAEPRSIVRRHEDDGTVVATIGRPAATIPAGVGSEEAARELAHRDVARLLRAVGVRMWLDDPPALPSPPELAARLAAATAAAADRHERLELLVACLRDRLGDDVEGVRGLLEAGGDDDVVDALYVRVLTGALALTGPEAAELHALAGGT